MIYLSGDNNLSLDMAYSIEQMRRITATNQNINILVYFDGYSAEIPTLYADFSGSYDDHTFQRSYKFKEKLFKVPRDINENSASMYNLLNFVHWGVNQVEYMERGVARKGRKGTNYAMIFSGHSMGFQSIGLFQDSKANYNMTMSKLRWALDRMQSKEADLIKWAADDEEKYKARQLEMAKKCNETIPDDELGWSDDYRISRQTEILGQQVSLLGFDSCMMGMLEVGSQFKGRAETMVASEGSIPNTGWSYAQMLADVANGYSSSTSAAIAIQFVDKYIKQQNRHAIGSVSVDIAAWDLDPTKVEQLDSAFEAFADALIKGFKASDVCHSHLKLALLSARFNCQSYTMEQNVDLVDLCKLLAKEIRSIPNVTVEQFAPLTDIVGKADAVIEAVRNCVLLSGFSGGKNQFSNGISIYFPWTKDSYCSSLNDYLRLRFVDRTTKEDKEKVYSKWKSFLEFYLSEITFRRSPALGKNDSSFIFESFTEDKDKNVEDKDCITRGNESHAERYPPYGRPGDRYPPYGRPGDRYPPYGRPGDRVPPYDVDNKVPPYDVDNKVPPYDVDNKVPPYDVDNKVPPYDVDNKVPPYDVDNKYPPYGKPGDKGLGDIVRGMTGAMGQFFDQYGRVKNVETPWNIAGFSTTNTELRSRNEEGRPVIIKPLVARNLPQVVVPPGTRIKRNIEDLLRNLSGDDEIKIAKQLYAIAELGDEAALNEILVNMKKSLKKPEVSVQDSFESALKSIKDEVFLGQIKGLSELKLK